MKIPRSPYLIWPVLCSAVFLLVLGLRYTGLLLFLELNAYDQFIRLHQRATPVDPRIVLVSITEQDIRDYGHPISDETMTAVLERLVTWGVHTVGVDIHNDLYQFTLSVYFTTQSNAVIWYCLYMTMFEK